MLYVPPKKSQVHQIKSWVERYLQNLRKPKKFVGESNWPETSDCELESFLLRESYKIIENKERWCQKIYARDKNGQPADWRAQNVYAVCTFGAIYRTAMRVIPEYYSPNRMMGEMLKPSYDYPMVKNIERKFNKLTGDSNHSFFMWQDNHTHEEVLAKWRKVMR